MKKLVGIVTIIIFLLLVAGGIYDFYALKKIAAQEGEMNAQIANLTQSQQAVVGYIQESITLGIFPSVSQLQTLASSTKK